MQEQRTRAEEGNEMILRRLNRRVLNRIGRKEGFTILEILITICILVFGFLATVSMHFAAEQEKASANDNMAVTLQPSINKEKSNYKTFIKNVGGNNLNNKHTNHAAIDILLITDMRPTNE